ncbi:hypothetical protein HAALTHF_15300n [Vreelandella aquamarina]|nr:hypothetical protein HAALTHF_15300n [Halomonas axialensis]
MYIAMNRFRIAPGREEDFLEVWRNRDSHLEEVPGFKEFHMLQGESQEEYTVFISHSVWGIRRGLPRLDQVRGFPQGPRQCQIAGRHLSRPAQIRRL